MIKILSAVPLGQVAQGTSLQPNMSASFEYKPNVPDFLVGLRLLFNDIETGVQQKQIASKVGPTLLMGRKNVLRSRKTVVLKLVGNISSSLSHFLTLIIFSAVF